MPTSQQPGTGSICDAPPEICSGGTTATRGTRPPSAGSHHLHIGPDQGHRIVADPVTLDQVAAKIVATHINLAR